MKIKAKIIKVVYNNADSGYSVLSVDTGDKIATVVGSCPGASEGLDLEAEGEFVNDKKFGEQFKATNILPLYPSTKDGMEKFLASGKIKGVSDVYAKRIVEKFGEETRFVLDMAPQRLAEVEGIGPKRLERIAKSWKANHEINDIMIFLQSIGITTAYTTKIYDKYGKKSVQAVKENPYSLADDIDGIGFLKADAIAKNLGITKNDPNRIQSGILYVMGKDSENGNVYSMRDKVIDEACKLLIASADTVAENVEKLISEERVMAEEECLYLPRLYYAEKIVSTRLNNLCKGVVKPIPVAEDNGIKYDEVQKEAIETAMRSKVMVLTGGPGCGKTFTTNGIIRSWEKAGLNILLAAPTGRAAKRMSEATGKTAKTIHRLLAYNPKDGFTFNKDNPLKGDALIVDEASMIDILLMRRLLEAVPNKMRVVLVGDVDQLPSVGAGNVLRDIIDSNEIPVVRLTRIFRQAMDSKIITNAHRINEGKMPEKDNSAKSDFFFIQEEDNEAIPKKIVSLVTERLPKYYKVDTADIQVLSPMKRTSNGVQNLNKLLQNAINPKDKGLKHGYQEFREGDRVMQMKNDYDKEVFNGDIGTVKSISVEDDTAIVDFDGNEVEYEGKDFQQLSLAYACTIHKSQGSEYKVVVIPLTTQFYMMLQRNLIYTAVTRAKKACVIIGQRKALAMAVKNKTIQQRNTLLKERLRGEVEKMAKIYSHGNI
jgi:exodeoxyribonuclease V alpha subunit